MWAVYLCGCTDCFLHALFIDKETAIDWAKFNSHNLEEYVVKFFDAPSDIPLADWKGE